MVLLDLLRGSGLDMTLNYYRVQDPTVFEYRYTEDDAVDSCEYCGWRENLQAVRGCIDVPEVDRAFFYSGDLVPIARSDISHLWGNDAELVPIGDTKYSQVVPLAIVELAISDDCREQEICQRGDHHSVRLVCRDVFVSPGGDPLVARSRLPVGSFDELRFEFFVRHDVNRYLSEDVLGYQSQRIRFVEDQAS